MMNRMVKILMMNQCLTLSSNAVLLMIQDMEATEAIDPSVLNVSVGASIGRLRRANSYRKCSSPHQNKTAVRLSTTTAITTAVTVAAIET